MIVDVYGNPKTGKSHFAMTFPDPIAYFVFDTGIEVIRKKFPDKRIDLFYYPMVDVDVVSDNGFPMPEAKTLIDSVYGRFLNEYFATIKNSEYQTIVIDTQTRLWEIIHTSYLMHLEATASKELERLQPRQYGKPNSVMRSIIDTAYDAGKHVVLVNYAKDEWVDMKPTGKVLADEWRGTEGMADIKIYLKVTGMGKGTKTIGEITASRFGREFTGMTIDNPTFDLLAELFINDVDVEGEEVKEVKEKKGKSNETATKKR